MKRTPYEVLGVDKAATPEKIKRAYRKKAAALHPDNIDTGDAEAFKPVAQAYKLLSDPKTKDIYDQTGIAMGEDKGLEAALMLLVEIAMAVLADDSECQVPMEMAKKLSQLTLATGSAISSMDISVKTIEKRWRDDSPLKASILMTLRRRIAELETTKATHRRAKELLDAVKYDSPLSQGPLPTDHRSIFGLFGGLR